MRTEKDFLGEVQVHDNCLYGINSIRAKNNFPCSISFNLEWYKTLGIVKEACYYTYKSYKKALSKITSKSYNFNLISDEIIDSLIHAAIEVSKGEHYEHFIVPAISGGAGTSINMNINEIICNRALQIINKKPGDYTIIDPIEHANIFQSTNDVIPTSLKLTIMRQLDILENTINELRKDIESLENKYRNNLRLGYTQMQEAVPTTFGKLFGSYSEALSRDWWRISKCFERIKVVNLGGSAIGTGITVPRYFIMEVTPMLQRLTGLPVTRSENMPDATSNLDSFVEIHSVIKAHAVNLEKIVSDLRLLASDIGHKEINIPQKQLGSSIMPNKVNPVIPEFVISIANKIYANDILITNLCAQGCLELNAYLPIIGHSILESLQLLIDADKTLKENMIKDITVNSEVSIEKLFFSPAITTALIPYIGYNKSALLANEMKKNKLDIFKANDNLSLIDSEKLNNILKTENLIKMGYTLSDLD